MPMIELLSVSGLILFENGDGGQKSAYQRIDFALVKRSEIMGEK